MSAMSEIPAELRPYEKVLKSGPRSLDDSELLAVILRSGTQGRNSVDVARSIIAAGNGSISGIRSLSYEQLLKIPGIGKVKAIQVLCLCTLIVRFSAAYYSEKECYDSPEWVAHRYMEELRTEARETVKVLYLNVKCGLIAEEDMTRGSLSGTVFPIREMLVGAFRHDAFGIIVIHNHPSGNPEPSEEDISVTGKLGDACALSGITLIDHLIIGDRKYVSFRELGMIS